MHSPAPALSRNGKQGVENMEGARECQYKTKSGVRQTDRQTGKKKASQPDRQTEQSRQTDRKADRQKINPDRREGKPTADKKKMRRGSKPDPLFCCKVRKKKNEQTRRFDFRYPGGEPIAYQPQHN